MLETLSKIQNIFIYQTQNKNNSDDKAFEMHFLRTIYYLVKMKRPLLNNK